MTVTPFLLADSITKRFGTNQVLTRVSLPVMERDVVCVVGPSGSGKTTLLRCFALLEAPSEGRIVMQGVPIATAEPDRQVKTAARAVRSDIGMVFQHFNLWPHMSVLENLIEAPMLVKKMPKDEAVAILTTSRCCPKLALAPLCRAGDALPFPGTPSGCAGGPLSPADMLSARSRAS